MIIRTISKKDIMFLSFYKLSIYLAFVQSCFAYSISEGSIKVGEQELIIGEFNTAVIKPLILTSEDSLQLSIQLSAFEKIPHQAVVTLGNDNGLEASFIPIVKDNGLLKLNIAQNKIPVSLKKESKLFLKLIVADFHKSQPLYQKLAEILPNEELLATGYNRPIRYGPKDEIHHVFRSDPKTVNPVISIVFVFAAVTLLIILIGTWTTLGDINFANLPSGFNVIHHIGLIGSIVGYEFVFLKYYLGTSIFTTIYSSAVLAAPCIWFGSRTLRDLLNLRKSNKI